MNTASSLLRKSILPEAQLRRLDTCFPSRLVRVGLGKKIAVRTAGEGDRILVCLHGIGSGGASWLNMAALLPAGVKLVAWDAPGYGLSTPLDEFHPTAMDYARQLDALFEALDLRHCLLVGHSLGALPACAFTRHLSNGRVRALALLSPAQGYGRDGHEAQQARVRQERLFQLQQHGVSGIASRRASYLVSHRASPQDLAWVQWNMARLNPGGYRQAIELLCGGNLLADLPPPDGVATQIACGEFDSITSPRSCAEVAAACGQPLALINGAGHACYVEQPRAILGVLQPMLDRTHLAPNNNLQDHA